MVDILALALVAHPLPYPQTPYPARSACADLAPEGAFYAARNFCRRSFGAAARTA